MKRIVFAVLVLMLAVVSFGYAESQYSDDGTNVGIASKVDFVGATVTRDGETATVTNTVFSAGINSISQTGIGATSGVVAIPLTAKVVLLDLNGDLYWNAKTIAAGTAGQILTIVAATQVGSYTAVVTPALCTGFTKITFTSTKQSVTLQYNTTLGWVIIGNAGTTIG